MMRRFFDRFDSLQSIKDSSEEEIVNLINELGMQNIKAKRIKMFCSAFAEDVDLIRDGIAGFRGVGDYTQESVDVFICRDRSVDAKDKEIKKYLERSYSFLDLKNRISSDIDKRGFTRDNMINSPKEILDYFYEYDSNMFCNVIDDRLVYVIDKLDTYKNCLQNVNERLKNDITTRQAVIQFDQSGDLPNCTVSIQFQIRDGVLYLSIFQRSQDIEKLEMDCEIFNRMALEVIKHQERVDDYRVRVFVGNMHRLNKKII
jgi:hypothetical protein